jgi:hypothetical protein
LTQTRSAEITVSNLNRNFAAALRDARFLWAVFPAFHAGLFSFPRYGSVDTAYTGIPALGHFPDSRREWDVACPKARCAVAVC